MCNPFQTTPYLYVYMIQAPNLNLCNMYYIYIYTTLYNNVFTRMALQEDGSCFALGAPAIAVKAGFSQLSFKLGGILPK